MTPHTQRLFIITEENLDKLVKNGVSKKSEEIAYLVKQYPYSSQPPSPVAPELTVGMVSAYEQGFEDSRNQTLDEAKSKLIKLTTAYPTTGNTFVWTSVIDAALEELRTTPSTREHQ